MALARSAGRRHARAMRGLIRYSTENAIENGWSWSKIVARVLRVRVIVYVAILACVGSPMRVALYLRVLDPGVGVLRPDLYAAAVAIRIEAVHCFRWTVPTGVPNATAVATQIAREYRNESLS